jgi:hypothetical protein
VDDRVDILSFMRDTRRSVLVLLRRNFQPGRSQDRLYPIRNSSRRFELAIGPPDRTIKQ